MPDVYSDAYWTEEFDITTVDLERIVRRMRETRSAFDLTELAKRVVRGRLRHGPEQSPAVLLPWARDPSVRLWDPAGEWKEGDQAIIWTWSFKARQDEVMVGEITHADPRRAYITVNDSYQPERKFRRATPGSQDAITWHQTVQKAVEEMQRGPSQEEQVRLVILEHGQRIVSRLLNALRADERFVRLAGRWFLRELAVSPTQEQLTALAWAMLGLEEPQPTTALVPPVQPPLAEGDPGLFGLYLAMRDHQDSFENVDPGKRPRWVLAGPPPGSFTPSYAAYEPETYEVLCLPGQPTPPEATKRLWDLGLLKAVR